MLSPTMTLFLGGIPSLVVDPVFYEELALESSRLAL
jgi:hypothetical protein